MPTATNRVLDPNAEQDPTEERRPDPVDLVQRIERRFVEFTALHQRMDDDFDTRWSLAKYVPDEAREGVSEDDAYTTNAPYVLAEEVISYITGSKLSLRVPNRRQDEQRREASRRLEEFAIGLMTQLNDRLLRRVDPELIEQMSWYAVVRGMIVMRSVMRKEEDETTFPDMTCFDPRNVVFVRDASGIRWLAHRIHQTQDEVEEDYRISLMDHEVLRSGMGEEGQFVRYDYYYRRREKDDNGFEVDRYYNAVISAERWLKSPAEVFSPTPRFPIIVVGKGAMPMLGATESMEKPIERFAESVFAANRDVWEAINRIRSYRQALVARSVNQAMAFYSQQGDKTPEDNPSLKGGVIPLSVQNQEKIEPIPLTETTRDATILEGGMARDETKGQLPDHAFGVVDAPLSGVALRQLGARIDHMIRPYLKTVERALQQGLENLIEQFRSGIYAPITVWGTTQDKSPFEAVIAPEDLDMAGRLQVKITPNLPQDTLEHWQGAQIATQQNKSGESIVGMRYARDEILQIEDPEQINREVFEQMARTASPVTLFLTLAKSAQEQHDEIMYNYWVMQAQQAKKMEDMQAMAQMGQLGAPPGQGQLSAGGPEPRRATDVDPRLIPNGAFGNQQDTASPQAGANTTSPRPGARSQQAQRLAAIGLEAPPGV